MVWSSCVRLPCVVVVAVTFCAKTKTEHLGTGGGGGEVFLYPSYYCIHQFMIKKTVSSSIKSPFSYVLLKMLITDVFWAGEKDNSSFSSGFSNFFRLRLQVYIPGFIFRSLSLMGLFFWVCIPVFFLGLFDSHIVSDKAALHIISSSQQLTDLLIIHVILFELRLK